MLVLLEAEASGFSARHVGLRPRLVNRFRAPRLDRTLAEGRSPEATVDLALRAQTLVRISVRRDLAKSVQRIVDLSTRPTPSTRLSVPVCRDRVAEAEKELHGLIEGLLTPGPVSARGVARVSVFLSDGRGPLYHRGNPDDLRSRIEELVDALNPLHGAIDR